MEQTEKLGLLEQFSIAISQPGRYHLLLKNTRKQIIQFIFLISLLLLIIENVIPLAGWNYSVGGVDHLITERLPKFEIKDGTFQIEEPVEILMQPLIYIAADDSIEKVSKDNFKKEIASQIVIGQKNMMLSSNGQFFSYDFASLGDETFDNNSLLQLVPGLKIGVFMTLIFYFFSKMITYLFFALFYTFMSTSAYRLRTKAGLTFKESFLIALYASAIGSIASSINMCMGAPLDTMLLSLIELAVTLFIIFKAKQSVIAIRKKQ